MLDEAALRSVRRSDTVFIFGSGASLNDITAEEWSWIGQHDTLGFNWFVHQQFVRCDYHLIRGIPDTDLDRSVWKPQLRSYFDLIRRNARFADTVFLVQEGFRATNGNRAIGYRLLPSGARVFRWRTIVGPQLPSRSLASGLVHVNSALDETINFAFLIGWRRIVLVGVDLYDRRYFWLSADETRSVDVRRGATAADLHNRAESGLVEAFGAWGRLFRDEGVELSVYNPRSLLAATLPVYERSDSLQ